MISNKNLNSEVRRYNDPQTSIIRKSWKKIYERFKSCPDTEVEQNIIRLLYTVIILMYVVYYGSKNNIDVTYAVLLCSIYIVVAVASFFWIYFSPVKSTARRVLYMLGDRIVVTWILAIYDTWISPIYIFYLWCDVGHPARYGREYLLPCVATSVLGYGFVLLVNPAWQAYGVLAYALWLGLVMMPMFSWQFFRRLKEANLRLAELATHDSLTQLPNRRLLYDQLNVAIAAAERYKRKFLVLFIDIDNFKKVNDHQGHEIGDKALCEAAKALQQAVRKGDCVARLGGDEFVVLLNNVKDTNHHRIAENLREAIRNYTKDNLSASIGVAQYPECGADAETLVRNADFAMYEAKNLGKGRSHIYKENKDHR